MTADVDLGKVAKDLVKATKELSRDKQAERIVIGELQRRGLHLKSVNRTLITKNKIFTTEQKKLTKEVETLKLRQESLINKNNELERENKQLEDDLEQFKIEIQRITTDITTKKVNLDTELEEYATVRKQEIKDTILETNRDLIVLQQQLADTSRQLEGKKTELNEINKIYVNEQTELKISNEETKQLIETNKQIKSDIQQEVTDLEQQVKQLQYDRDNLEVSMTKAKAEHEQFLEYEKKARKILETKDQELQKRSSEIATESQFLTNRRSFLPKL